MVVDLLSRGIFHLAKPVLKPRWAIAIVSVLRETVGIQQQNVARTEQRPLVHLVVLFEAERAFNRVAIDDVQ